jgi:hypothetical protein
MEWEMWVLTRLEEEIETDGKKKYSAEETKI